ncbi:hypothetical protein DQ04_00691090 [Trypanosoma grayi]|uniref:hypothetical protein n=1 Tax=Trypanosoma grayi TaxID=71804 RepID=UPI0004F46D2C|nr:hypothetical protein DQ04_00691090 [Trypanosoma grayi]KEG13963.1 hypothetical protein DQ04_00691090 [Trypanosoma grayi]
MTDSTCAKEQIIVYDSESDDVVAGGETPSRTVAQRAELILFRQQCCGSAGERNVGRQQLADLGGAYSKLCRGSPLSLWVVGATHAQPTTANALEHPLEQASSHTPKKNRDAPHDDLIVPSPTGGSVYGCRSPLPKKAVWDSTLSDLSSVSAGNASSARRRGNERRRRSFSAAAMEEEEEERLPQCSSSFNSTASPSQALPLTPDSLTTESMLSQAELSAVHILAHDIEGVAPACWRASHVQLSPCAIYAEDDKMRHRVTAAADVAPDITSPAAVSSATASTTAKRKRVRVQLGVVSPFDANEHTARRLHFDTEDFVKPSRPSVSGTAMRWYNDKAQQRVGMCCLLPL